MINPTGYEIRVRVRRPFFGDPVVLYELYQQYSWVKVDFYGWPDDKTGIKLLLSSTDECKINALYNKLNKVLEAQ